MLSACIYRLTEVRVSQINPIAAKTGRQLATAVLSQQSVRIGYQERCAVTINSTIFVHIDPHVVRGQIRGLLQRPLTGSLHFGDLLDPDNLNEDQSSTAQLYMVKLVIVLNLYRTLQGYQWKNVVRVVDGDVCGAEVEFVSQDEALRFDVNYRSYPERAS